MVKTKKKVAKLKEKFVKLYVNSESNANTIISITDLQGNVIRNFSSGQVYKGKAKASQAAIEELFSAVIDFCALGKIQKTDVVLRGTGAGVTMAGNLVCAKRNGINILGDVQSITFDSNVKYGGTRSRKQRRG
jgi:ribosomal protein S11